MPVVLPRGFTAPVRPWPRPRQPLPRPYEFDLAQLLPNGTFRRLYGSPEQDPTANDGKPVGARIRLEGKEGLFLVKED